MDVDECEAKAKLVHDVAVTSGLYAMRIRRRRERRRRRNGYFLHSWKCLGYPVSLVAELV